MPATRTTRTANATRPVASTHTRKPAPTITKPKTTSSSGKLQYSTTQTSLGPLLVATRGDKVAAAAFADTPREGLAWLHSVYPSDTVVEAEDGDELAKRVVDHVESLGSDSKSTAKAKAKSKAMANGEKSGSKLRGALGKYAYDSRPNSNSNSKQIVNEARSETESETEIDSDADAPSDPDLDVHSTKSDPNPNPTPPFATDLDQPGTPFQHRVWDALCAIPRGETVTYGELARRLGMPSSVRAVARACAANKIAVVVPCHRVVGASGITGYRWGVERKRMLLEMEGAGDWCR